MCVLTDGSNELFEEAVREEGFRQLSEEELQCSGDDVDLLILPVLQIQILICT